MIVKPRPAAAKATSPAASEAAILAMPTLANVPRTFPSHARIALPALVVAACAALMPVREVLAQAPAPAAAPVAGAGASRDFAAERKAIGDSRAWTNYRFAAAEHECYGKFFVNRCIDQAKEIQRGELQVLRTRELEVGEAERAHRAAERDREQALRRAEFEASQPKRAASEQSSREAFEKKQQEQQLRDAQRQGEAPQRAANAQAYQQKQSDARMKEAQQKGAAQAQQRQENVKAYEAKQRDLEQRQKELEERRAKAKEQQNPASAPRPFGF